MARSGAGRTRGPANDSYIEFIGSDVRISVPDDPDGERAAVAAHPEFQRRLAAARQDRAEGRTIPMDHVFDDIEPALAPGAEPRETREIPPPKRGRPPAGEPQGRLLIRVPASIHRELVARAAQERTTLNQLVLSYISRGLGADTAR